MTKRVTETSVSSAEWRWVIIFSGLLVALTLIPYAWAFASDSPADSWQFMGQLYNPQDAATYLSKMELGVGGSWLYYLTYTSEPHDGAAINVFYLFLGHMANVLGLSPLLTYHIVRLVTSFTMYLALYHLGSSIWQRLRPRRLFFSICAVGSGFGFLFAGNLDLITTDLKIPESIPFYATLVNPHFPLTIALIAMLAAAFIVVFRPGFTAQPDLANGGGTIFGLSLLISLVQPQGWVPITSALCVYLVVQAILTRKLPIRELNWVLLVVLPGIPLILYYLAVVNVNQAMAVWNAQNLTPSPSIDRYILGYGLPLFIAVPGIWRAVRHFERDGDRFMLIWLVVNTAWLYAPFNLQRRLSIGLIIPIVYFTVRALEDYWFYLIKRRVLRDAVLVVLFVFLVPSNVLTLLLPLYGVLNPSAGVTQALLLPIDEARAVGWLTANGQPGTVALAKTNASLWIPAYSRLRVVYGHPYETIRAEDKRQDVAAWYARGERCQEILDIYRVRYVVIYRDDPSSCAAQMDFGSPVYTSGNVAVYLIR
jgi:hypothetical protein